ncbi:hypothetical protein HDU84_000609 [Entophlyctis sp. JEL0112]|nr:hypothetical protein HDU84_000609 [Entophlyctis sp. JEL0112]
MNNSTDSGNAGPANSLDAAISAPAWESAVGVSLALLSNAFIGASVVFRKRGLLDVQSAGFDVAAGSTAYLRNVFWWAGMILLAIGELSNFGAYAFSPAILVTPLGTLSVVISTVMSNYILKEKLTFLGKTGCALCILGVIMIVTHAPTSQTTDTIPGFMYNVFQPVFVVYSILIAALMLFMIFWAEPRYARQTPLVYINYLNKAMAVYSTAIVYPIHYVCFTGMTMITTAFLYREFPVSSIDAGGVIIEGFLVLVVGVMLLYKSNFEDQRNPVHKQTDVEDGVDMNLNNNAPVLVVAPALSTRTASRHSAFGSVQQQQHHPASVFGGPPRNLSEAHRRSVATGADDKKSNTAPLMAAGDGMWDMWIDSVGGNPPAPEFMVAVQPPPPPPQQQPVSNRALDPFASSIDDDLSWPPPPLSK